MWPLSRSDSHLEPQVCKQSMDGCWCKERILCTKMSGRIPFSDIFPRSVLQCNSWHGNLICMWCFQDTHTCWVKSGPAVYSWRCLIAQSIPAQTVLGLDQSLEDLPGHCCSETHYFLWDNSQVAVFSSFWSLGGNPAGKDQDGLALAPGLTY